MKIFFKGICSALIIAIVAIFINGTYYVFCGQLKSYEKLKAGQELSKYEVASIYTMHTACWMFGWIIEPNTAELCFCKQFHIPYQHKFKFVKDDEHLAELRNKLKVGQSTYLAWKLPNKMYISGASILLNGATVKFEEQKEDGTKVYKYTNPANYGKGLVYIAGVPFCESLFDYLENTGILSTEVDVRYVEYTN